MQRGGERYRRRERKWGGGGRWGGIGKGIGGKEKRGDTSSAGFGKTGRPWCRKVKGYYRQRIPTKTLGLTHVGK